VSNGPLGSDWSGLVQQLVVSRTVADTAAFLDVLAQDATGGPFLAATTRPPARLRVARSLDTSVGVKPEPACIAAADAACTALAELGHEIEDVTGPILPSELYDQFIVLWCTSAASIPVDPAREHLLRPLTRTLRERGHALSAPQLAAALGLIGNAVRSAAQRFAGYDLIVCPTLAQLPARVGQLRDDDDPWSDFDAQVRYTPYTAIHNTTGWPSISLPTSWIEVPRSQAPGGGGDDGDVTLPVGVMLTAHAGHDALLLSVAAQLEAALPWRDRRPPVW
jgi:amidase